MNEIEITDATARDVGALLQMACREAEYEKLTDHFTATEEKLRATLFGSKPAAEAIIAWAGEEPVGFAVFYTTFSTFSASTSIWLEDLFVEEAWRGKGVGKMLMAHVAKKTRERKCHSLNWSVLKWNEPAIRFYRSLGAEELEAWKYFQLSGQALATLSANAE